MKKIIILLFALALLVGCKTQKATVVEVPIQYKERIVEKLVPVKVADDSLSMKALFECDSLNNVVMKQLTEAKSKGVASKFDFNAGILNYHVVTVHDTIYIPGKETILEKEVAVRVEVPVEINKLTQWQILQIWAGRALLALLLIRIGLTYLKRFTTAFK